MIFYSVTNNQILFRHSFHIQERLVTLFRLLRIRYLKSSAKITKEFKFKKSLPTSEKKVIFKQNSNETLNCQINTTYEIKIYNKGFLGFSTYAQLHTTNRKLIFVTSLALLAFSYSKPGLQFFFQFNPLTTNVPHHLETSQLICTANQLTGFYMMENICR